MSRTYLVIENTPGCLPESEPLHYTSRRDAERDAADRAREYRESGYRVTGNCKDGYYCERHSNDLGRVIEVVEVTE